VVGNTKLSGEDGNTARRVAKKFKHENYNDQSIQNDIMLLQLDASVSQQYRPVQLNFDASIPNESDGKTEEFIVIGLGQTRSGSLPETLQYVDLPEFPFPDCEDYYVPQVGGFFQEIFSSFFSDMEESEQICAGGERGKDSCSGDSGGPLVIAPQGGGANNDDGSEDLQLGLTSYGLGCANDSPAVYTRISGYETWIKDRVCENSSDPPDYCDGYESGDSNDDNNDEDVTVPDLGGGVFCFSGEDTVEMEHVGTIPMKDLKIGDSILVRDEPNDKKYERVYSFGHRSDSIPTEFLSIQTTDGAALELTKDHLIFVEEGMSIIPASDLKQQQQLIHNHQLVGIESVDTVTRVGMYAPFTPSGELIVNGFRVSTFVAVHGSATIEVLGMELQYQMISKLFESPRRLLCRYVSCDNESYDVETGISTWHGIALNAYRWLLKQNTVVFHLGFLSAFAVVGSMALLEFFLMNFASVQTPISVVVIIVIAEFVSKKL